MLAWFILPMCSKKQETHADTTSMERQKEDAWPVGQEGHEAVTVDYARDRAGTGVTQCHNIT